MKPYSRQLLILDRVAATAAVSIEELIDETGASASTVRRDIRALEASGRVVSLRGGAVAAVDRLTELPAAAKTRINQSEKDLIARAAAEQVRDDDTVYIDSGTTATRMLVHLRSTRAHVVTSNMQLLTAGVGARMRVTILGGDYLHEIGSVAGALTDRMLGDLFFDKAFVGTNGISRRAGVTTFDVREANKKRIVQAHSRETWVLADRSKFGQVSLCRAFELSVASVITDAYDELLQDARSFIVATDTREVAGRDCGEGAGPAR